MKDYSVLLTCGEANMVILHDAFDKGYQQGYADAKSELGQNAIDLAHEENVRAYQQGLEDAWEAARKIALDDCGLPIREVVQIFYTSSFCRILRDNTASEAIAKIKEYENEQNTIQVGDEVNHQGLKSVVIRIADDCIYTITEYGTTPKYDKNDNLVKTGRHFDAIAEVLAEMRGEEC